jgi:glycosyltransferase involved in cell wall biosynthesis
MDEQFPSVSVIIPMRNECDHIHACLQSLLKQDYPLNQIEILVVDGRSTDRSRQVVEEYARQRPNLELLDNPKQSTPAALNVGIRRALGEVVLRIDAHSRIPVDYVRQCIFALRQSGADAVGGVMCPIGQGYIGQAIALAVSSRFGAGDSKYHYAKKAAFVDTVPWPAYRREIFREVGLFDETLIRNQDYELNYRIRQQGGNLFFSPAIRYYYIPRSSLPALWRQYFQYGRWKIRTLQKHPGSLRWRQIIPPLLVIAVLGSLLLCLLWTPGCLILGLVVIIYLLTNLIVSTIMALRRNWRFIPILPIAFVCIHFAWGLGFWYSLMLAPFRSRR